MHRLLAVLCGLLLLAGSTVATVSAQDATPDEEDVSTEATPTGDATGDPAVGDRVPYVDENGEEIGFVTVESVTDDFDDFDEFFTPEEDARYLAVELSFESTGDEFEANPFDFGVQTVDGFFYSTGFVSREDNENPPELESTTVEEGESTSGVIFFVVPAEAELTRLFWQPDTGRLLVVADLAAA